MASANARATGRPWTRDLGFLLAILAIAAGIRMWGPRGEVFTPDGVNFLEPDAWYHVRLAENQAHNFPFRVTHDPYASPDGMYVPVAPLFDTAIAALVVVTGGTSPGTDHVARVAAFVPPALGVLAVALVYALGRLAFGSRAALLAATLAAILPGQFLDRTLLGYVDHHALEVALALAVLLALGRVAGARDGNGPPSPRDVAVSAVLPGTMLGWYLLSWSSGALLVAVIAVWLSLQALADAWAAKRDGGLARVVAAAAAVALALVLAFQDPALHRYGSQIVALAGLAALGVAIDLARRFEPGRRAVVALVAGGAVVATVAALAVRLLAPGVFATVVGDVLRFAPDPARMSVLEARPLFLFSGAW
ncbi:MAG: STT3 domain-containing protein, partial [Vicinamibacteria bacterium]